jgi:hypothetical protein
MTAPITFNWVQARSNCSIEQAFITLREVVDSDVKERNIQLNKRGDDRVLISYPTDTKFIVIRQWDAGGIPSSEGIVFERTPTGLVVEDAQTQRPLFAALPALTPGGECKFTVEGKNSGEPLEFWQVSRLALETLFFRR